MDSIYRPAYVADCDGVAVVVGETGFVSRMSDWGALFRLDWIGRGVVEPVAHNSGGLGGESYRWMGGGRPCGCTGTRHAAWCHAAVA